MSNSVQPITRKTSKNKEYVTLRQLFISYLKLCYMDLLHRLEFWGDRHHPKWMDIIRIALGIFLVYKAIDFLNNMSDLVTLMSANHFFRIL